ncbi:hypothetical protein [Streptomyces coelicoflavus]|uniref:hypothetical protein n=1 Tax=Streptomyces coelicoflavus TaxID=285562 RepID=UPI0036889E8F
MAMVAAMLDDNAGGTRARVLAPGEVLPHGTVPMLMTDTTVYGATRLEEALLRWGSCPSRGWCGWPTPRCVPCRMPASWSGTWGRLAGVVQLPYLSVLRAVEGPDEALGYKDVQAAAVKLRRTIEGK